MVIYMIKRGNVTYNKKTGILDITNGEIIDMNKTETPSENTDGKKKLNFENFNIFNYFINSFIHIFEKQHRCC